VRGVSYHLDVAELAGNLQRRDAVGIERVDHILPVSSKQLLDESWAERGSKNGG
jgi:hypothetical protein